MIVFSVTIQLVIKSVNLQNNHGGHDGLRVTGGAITREPIKMGQRSFDTA